MEIMVHARLHRFLFFLLVAAVLYIPAVVREMALKSRSNSPVTDPQQFSTPNARYGYGATRHVSSTQNGIIQT
jgi:hypothetical protein